MFPDTSIHPPCIPHSDWMRTGGQPVVSHSICAPICEQITAIGHKNNRTKSILINHTCFKESIKSLIGRSRIRFVPSRVKVLWRAAARTADKGRMAVPALPVHDIRRLKSIVVSYYIQWYYRGKDSPKYRDVFFLFINVGVPVMLMTLPKSIAMFTC